MCPGGPRTSLSGLFLRVYSDSNSLISTILVRNRGGSQGEPAMDRVETSSTSSRSAQCSPIVLRETGRVRLVFRPMLVVNDKQPKACITGDFVYETKSAKDSWEPLNDTSLKTVKAGEHYRLELHSSELLELLETLGPLYRAQWAADGTPAGRQVLVKLDRGLARFLQLGKAELEQFFDAHADDALAVLGKLVQWLSVGSASVNAAKALSAMDLARLPAVSALLGLSTLKAALQEWAANATNDSEEFWQGLFSKHSFVLSQLFAHPVVVIQEKAYLGGKALDNTGGSYLDFLAASSATQAVALIEIKTPGTLLLGPEYRTGAFPASPPLSGALAQALKYRHTFATEFARLGKTKDHDLVLGGAPCLIIVGNAGRELNPKEKRESFESFRCQLNNVRIVTFDELLTKLRVSVQLLEGVNS